MRKMLYLGDETVLRPGPRGDWQGEERRQGARRDRGRAPQGLSTCRPSVCPCWLGPEPREQAKLLHGPPAHRLAPAPVRTTHSIFSTSSPSSLLKGTCDPAGSLWDRSQGETASWELAAADRRSDGAMGR